jgi:hypothetical protein
MLKCIPNCCPRVATQGEEAGTCDFISKVIDRLNAEMLNLGVISIG